MNEGAVVTSGLMFVRWMVAANPLAEGINWKGLLVEWGKLVPSLL